jgi:O-antigen/teichoic acid export membrane protein
MFLHVFRIPAERLPAAHWVYQAACFSTVASVLSVPYDAAINAHEHMGLLAATATLEAILKLAVAFYLLHTRYDRLVVFGILMMGVTLISIILRVVYCRRNYPECRPSPRISMDRRLLWEITAFGGWSFLGSSASLLTNFGTVPLLNYFFGPSVNAAQGVAIQLNGQLGAFAGTLMKAVNPHIDKSEGAGAREHMLKVTFMATKAAFFLMAILILPVMLEMPWIFHHWLKALPPYAIIFTELLLTIRLVEQLFVPLASAIGAIGEIRTYQLAFAIVTIFPLPVSYLLFRGGCPPFWIYVIFLGYTTILLFVTGGFLARAAHIAFHTIVSQTLLRCTVPLAVALIPTGFVRLELPPGICRVALVAFVWFLAFPMVFWLLGLAPEERERTREEGSAAIQSLRRRWRLA